jgi:hypothetical protein
MDLPAVILLVKEISCLLAILEVNMKFQPIFPNDDLR